MINPSDIRIIHNYEVTSQYGGMSYEGNVVYLRHLVDGYDETAFDIIDKMFESLIRDNRNVVINAYSRDLLDSDAKIDSWDNLLKQQYQYVALCRDYWLDNTYHYLIDVRHMGTVLCEVANPSCLLLGKYNNVKYNDIDAILNIGVSNPAEMLQEHPFVHGISCFVNEKNNQVLLLYRFAPKFEYVRAIYDIKSETVHLTFNDTEADYLKFENEVTNIKNSIDYRRLSLNRELDLFTNAKTAVLAETAIHKERIIRDFEEYLKPIKEI